MRTEWLYICLVHTDVFKNRTGYTGFFIEWLLDMGKTSEITWLQIFTGKMSSIQNTHQCPTQFHLITKKVSTGIST
jgi:hypothetical protein